MTARRPNYLAGALAAFWLVIVLAPVYVLVKASLQTQPDYDSSGPLSIPHRITTGNFSHVIHSGFLHFFVNTGIITVAVVAIVVVLVPPVAFAIVRNRSRTVTLVFRVFLLGLAVPIQAVIVPIYFLITKAGLYDTLIAVILPTAAFSLPISTIIMTGSMRDITGDLYEAMALDGASSWRTFRHLALAARPRRSGDDHRLLRTQCLERLPASADSDAVGQCACFHARPVRLPDRQLDRRTGHLRRRRSLDHPDSGRVPVCPTRSDPGPDGRWREVTADSASQAVAGH